jgi:hypothetical protein
MRIEYIYDIRDFRWIQDEMSFYADLTLLYPVERKGGTIPFPNGKNQFFIKNFDTGGYRRFNFVQEFSRSDPYYLIETLWEFVSEDGIYCRIRINDTLYPTEYR